MADNGSIRLEGMDELLKAMKAKRTEINRAAAVGLKTAGMGIIADAQENLSKNGSWATGPLANSGRVIFNAKEYAPSELPALLAVNQGGDEGLDVGFFDQADNTEGYAHYVEYGRKAGKFPPVGALDNWIFKKFSLRVVRGGKKIRPQAMRSASVRKPAKRKPSISSQSKPISGASLAYLIARKIATKGSTPHPFFNPAVHKWQPRIAKAIADAVKLVIR